MERPWDLVEAAGRRYRERKTKREATIRDLNAGGVAAANTGEELGRRLARKAMGARRDAPGVREGWPMERGLERLIGKNNLVGVNYFDRAIRASRTIARVVIRDRNGTTVGYGTGFLVSPRLLLTNQHVLETIEVARPSRAEFNFQDDVQGRNLPIATFDLDPATCFLASPYQELDFALVAVNERSIEGTPLRAFGWNRLVGQLGKAVKGECMNIIQHPEGQPKQLALRDNVLVDMLDHFLHYTTDTLPGSSGSPVYNDEWEVAALLLAIRASGTDGALASPECRPIRVETVFALRLCASNPPEPQFAHSLLVRALQGQGAFHERAGAAWALGKLLTPTAAVDLGAAAVNRSISALAVAACTDPDKDVREFSLLGLTMAGRSLELRDRNLLSDAIAALQDGMHDTKDAERRMNAVRAVVSLYGDSLILKGWRSDILETVQLETTEDGRRRVIQVALAGAPSFLYSAMRSSRALWGTYWDEYHRAAVAVALDLREKGRHATSMEQWSAAEATLQRFMAVCRDLKKRRPAGDYPRELRVRPALQDLAELHMLTGRYDDAEAILKEAANEFAESRKDGEKGTRVTEILGHLLQILRGKSDAARTDRFLATLAKRPFDASAWEFDTMRSFLEARATAGTPNMDVRNEALRFISRVEEASGASR